MQPIFSGGIRIIQKIYICDAWVVAWHLLVTVCISFYVFERQVLKQLGVNSTNYFSYV